MLSLSLTNFPWPLLTHSLLYLLVFMKGWELIRVGGEGGRVGNKDTECEQLVYSAEWAIEHENCVFNFLSSFIFCVAYRFLQP